MSGNEIIRTGKSQLLIEQLQIELEHVRIQEKVTIYEALIEYLMGRQLQQFLETEKALYLQKREFFFRKAKVWRLESSKAFRA